MYVVSVQAHYDSAHFLRNYKGKCENLHGHRYVVEVALQSEELNEAGLAYDFVDVKKHLRALADGLDHQNINDLPPFDEIEPSAENQARFFFDQLKERLPDGMKDALLYTRIWETPTQFAQYSEKALAF
jgi:6-pyruvoyltetrahydropterin/6-carboxytetrahydropterin synthase